MFWTAFGITRYVCKSEISLRLRQETICPLALESLEKTEMRILSLVPEGRLSNYTSHVFITLCGPLQLVCVYLPPSGRHPAKDVCVQTALVTLRIIVM